MVSIIKKDQVVGSDHLDLLLCGICKNLAVKPQVHDGGYNQNFCQRFFCSTCLPVRINSPFHKRVNRRGVKETNCPFYPNCTVDFNHPYFRKLSGFERMEFNKVIIICQHCARRFSIDNYLDHIVRCLRGESSGNVSNNNNTSSGAVSTQPWVSQSLQKLKLQVTSVNQLRVPVVGQSDNNNIIINFRSINGFHSIELPENIGSVDALKKIADDFNLDHTKIDLLFVSHMSIHQFEKLIDFIQDCPRNGDLNLVTRNEQFSDPRNDLRLSLLGAHPNRGYFQANQ